MPKSYDVTFTCLRCRQTLTIPGFLAREYAREHTHYCVLYMSNLAQAILRKAVPVEYV
jgi:hypothetical protein